MAHYLAIVVAIALVALIFGLIIWAHVADQRAFDRNNTDTIHKSCKYVDLNEESLRASQAHAAGDVASTLGKFLAAMLNAAVAKHQAA